MKSTMAKNIVSKNIFTPCFGFLKNACQNLRFSLAIPCMKRTIRPLLSAGIIELQKEFVKRFEFKIKLHKF